MDRSRRRSAHVVGHAECDPAVQRENRRHVPEIRVDGAEAAVDDAALAGTLPRAVQRDHRFRVPPPTVDDRGRREAIVSRSAQDRQLAQRGREGFVAAGLCDEVGLLLLGHREHQRGSHVGTMSSSTGFAKGSPSRYQRLWVRATPSVGKKA